MKHPKIIQIVGYKNTGKTTLVCRLIEKLQEDGYKVGAIKNDAHQFEMDTEGTDTWKYQKAGADSIAITSQNGKETSIIHKRYTPLTNIIEQMSDKNIIVVEGFKLEKYQKIVMIRSEEHIKLITSLDNVIAAVSWIPLAINHIPVYSLDDIDSIVSLINPIK
ncbi:molybdopterin-guanine dinucleotide biosynthesis protein B [Chengkuizengella axinellae]|uniref:Molybdopterin-guanine dinucleotide biosynthesis protein B n=1 Tax=Chengkuizengella axinellae TaxID=3064388 RepID=A0ABT9J289_9BACL|nr:molybdopterin-guanine dinucleotide biosynthesis protein B [Chengkuizengella sp. 2205SS18-9]MDP5275608.1 molybdopterin-guanine dinucleotide biosynthesis protein B [Chengkuizengella sp. 2205SS18-9]